MAILSSIATALGISTTALQLGITAAAATGVGISQAGQAMEEMAKVPERSPMAMPESSKETAGETISNSKQTAQLATQSRLKSQRRSRSIYSSPLGIAGEAATAKKTLLGQ